MDIYRELKIRCFPGFGHLPQEIPIHISSGYRCPKLNTLVGGTRTANTKQAKQPTYASLTPPSATSGSSGWKPIFSSTN